MSHYSVLMMNLEPHACPTQNCGRLQGLIQQSLSVPGWHVLLQSTRFFPERRINIPPDLVVVRVSRPALFSEAAGYVRSQWGNAMILGLLCCESETSVPLSSGVTRDLDDYLACPFDASDIAPRIQSLFTQVKPSVFESLPSSDLDASLSNPALLSKVLKPLFGKSQNFIKAVQKIPRLANSDANLLLLGETGTGKELFARAIHELSSRREKAFVPLNCGAIPDHLFENELFGHERGAFTDASSFEKGVLSEAEGGTLLLDEVDALSPAAQVKLLRFLQDRVYRPLGQSKTLVADVRIIAATNRDLVCEVKAHRFREDVYYRLNLLCLSLPPLRERLDDVPALSSYFLSHYARKYGRSDLCFCPDALQKLLSYSWPGNVRELEALIHRAVAMSQGRVIEASEIELPLCNENKMKKGSFREAKLQAIAHFERTYLIDLLARHRGNVSQAARAGKTDRRALQRLLRKYALSPKTFH